MSNNSRIAKNTIFLYIRLLITLLVSLYTARVILNALGFADYGLYNVVGGIVVMFSFINSGMVQASQRFMAFEIGKGASNDLNAIFATTNTIHFIIAGVILLLAETIGLWFLNTQMNIDPDRMVAANWVYQFSVFTFLVGVISVPYNAALIAHEHMDVYAYFSILEVGLKLLIVFLIQIIDTDKLIFYAFMVFIVSVINRIVYNVYCRIKFEECKFSLVYNKEYFGKILSFAGWSFFGNIGFSFKKEGINILINIFFGTIVNAARGVAYQVSGIISQFSNSFQMAIIPQIVKQYAAGNEEGMLSLSYRGAKFSFYLLYFLALPLLLITPFVLEVWLKAVPDSTVIFLRLTLIVSLIDCTAVPIGKAIDATGNIKLFQILIACIMLCDIPISYLFLMLGMPAYTVMYVAIFTSSVCLFVRLFLLKKYIPKTDILLFIKEVLLRICIVAIITYTIMYKITSLHEVDWIWAITICILSVVVNAVVMFFIGLNKPERDMIINKCCQVICKKQYE